MKKEFTEKGLLIDEMVASIKEISSVLNENDIVHWLDFGALLGMIRENRLLPWDNDAEITCWWDGPETLDKLKKVTDKLNELNYDAYLLSGIGAISVKKLGVSIAISCYYRKDDYATRPYPEVLHHPKSRLGYYSYLIAMMNIIYHSNKFNKTRGRNFKSIIKFSLISLVRFIPKKIRKKMYLRFLTISEKFDDPLRTSAIPAKYYEKLLDLNFYGYNVKIPNNTKEYLKVLYGEGWNTPKKDWHFHDDKYKDTSKVEYWNKRWEYENYNIK